MPMQGLIDKDSETIRLKKEIDKISKELEKTKVKLNNANYINKAPAEIVEKERDKLTELQLTIDKLTDSLQMINEL